MDEPGRNYPLFFHDDAVALAAGHRPCGQCRPEALGKFIEFWKQAGGHKHGEWIPIAEIDAHLHDARVRERRHRSRSQLPDLPDGTFLLVPQLDCRPLVKRSGDLLPWQHGGYSPPIAEASNPIEAIVLTPAPIVKMLKAGHSVDVFV